MPSSITLAMSGRVLLHGDPGNVIELAVFDAAHPAAAARRRELIVFRAVAMEDLVAMDVAAEDVVLPARQRPLDRRPAVLFQVLGVPDRLVEEDERPAHLLVRVERLRDPLLLFLVDGAHAVRRVLGAEAHEERVLVDEVVIALAVASIVNGGSGFVGAVVVAGDVEERRLELLHVAIELIPLLVEHVFLERVALDQVADRHDERRLQQVDLLHGAGEDFVAMAAGAVGDDREVELIRIVIQVERSPGVLRRPR